MATNTPFSSIYDAFLRKVTDDMFMELTMEDTKPMLKDLFLSAIVWFEFPRFDLWNFDAEAESYNIFLTKEEIQIISVYMVVEWIGQQLATVQNTRMKYSGTDFKFTSQANHMAKLQALRREYERMGFHLQRLYKRRRKDKYGRIRSTMDIIMAPLKDIDYNGGGSGAPSGDISRPFEQSISIAKDALKAVDEVRETIEDIKNSSPVTEDSVQTIKDSIGKNASAIAELVQKQEKNDAALADVETLSASVADISDILEDNTNSIKEISKNMTKAKNTISTILKSQDNMKALIQDIQKQLSRDDADIKDIKDKLDTLLGSGDGSIDKKLQDAINDFKKSMPDAKDHLKHMLAMMQESVLNDDD